jgi:3-oxoacyl-[acyl-carrier protein] reductase
MKEFSGKTAIVTGAGSGIGYGIAEALADNGANVVINDIQEDLVNQFLERKEIKGIPGDMSSLPDIKGLVNYTLEQFGAIDMLVANAGITHFAPFLEIREAEFDKVVNLNLKGTFFLTQMVARVMRSRGGKIVLISSNMSKRAYPNLAVYSMTKSALNMMSRSLSLELAPYHININTLAPGPTITERTLQEGADYRATWSKIVPTGRPSEIHDIANAVMFLLSEKARQINGQTIFVDGGWTGISVNPV